MSILNIHSFTYAFTGLKTALQDQLNFRFHLLATVIVIVVCFFLSLTLIEWALVLSAIFSVLIAELFNSALEYLANAVTSNVHPLIKKAKDVAATAVLMSAFYALSLAFIIILPKIFS